MLNADFDKTTENLFKLAVEIEKEAANVYEKFSKVFAYMPQIFAFWSGMRDDELEHATTLQGISKSLSAEQLISLPDHALWNSVVDVRRMLGRDLTVSVENLDDAYELAHELESSEVNNIFKFLTSHYVASEEQEKLLDMQIVRHLKKLMDFSSNYGDRHWRKEFKIQGGGSK